MKCNLFKRITSVFLAVVLIFSNLPAAVFAAEDTGLCAHHTVHMDCGYQEAAAGADCTHVCGEDCYEAVIACVHLHEDCGYVAAVEEIPCDHVHADCGYTEAVEGTPCDHVHGDCGYAEAVEGTPCDHAHGDCGYVAAVEGTPCDHVCGEDCTESCVHSCEDGTCTYTEGVSGSDCTHVCGDGSCGYCEGIPRGECTHVCTDGSCAYREGVNGTPCTHTCGDGTCAYTSGMAERPCDHQCTEESGCVTRVLRCGHVHDEACGYVQAQAAQPCGYECQLCREEKQAPAELDSVTRQFTRQANPDPGLPENEELFQAYVEQMLFDTQLATFGTKGRDSLNEAEQELYDALKVHIESVALSGGDTSYVLTSPKSLKTRWTNEELNMDSLTEEAVQAAFDAQFDPDALMEALIRDCPFELYWYDKTAGMETTYSLSLEGYNDGTADFWTAASVEDVTFAFYVAQDYQGSRYSVTTDVETVARVRETAQELADAGKQLNDREALESFRTYICGAVSYDHDAADDATRPYGDPWQLIHVFDGDDTTNVVCEGYAKAFQYLCDLADLPCECVSGQLTSQGETEAHMWNVVTLEGARCLVDVTNCDEDTVGADTQLFLVTAPYVSGTYTFDCDGTEVTYTCADLNLAAEDEEEQPEEHTHTIDETTGQCACGLYGTCGENLTWTFAEESGILTISGEGDMPDYSYTEVPWYGFRTSVQKVALDERITTIGNNAFYGFTKLKEVTIPAGVTMIGMAAFWECGSLTEITIPDQVKEIGYAAFSGCSSLTTIVFPESITYVGDRAFEYCSKLASINIPSGVTYIREYTFAYCTALERITIPKNVVCIEKYAFRNCSSLTAIDFRGEPPTIYDTAFTGVTATARYSKDMPVWSSYRKDYGGTITWVAYGLCDEGHTEVTYPGSAPTCTEPGSTPLKYCEVCLEILLQDELIPATGHTEVIDAAVEATCTEPGLTEGSHCSVCGEVLVVQEEIPAGHTEVIDEAVDATCTEPGLTEGSHCSVCGEVLVAQEEIPAEHAFDYTGEFFVCSRCNLLMGTTADIIWELDTQGKLTFSGYGQMENYEAIVDVPWNQFAEDIRIIVIESGVTSVGKYAFTNFTEVTSVTLPDGITRIGAYAFEGCSGLTELVLPASVDTVDGAAFRNCTGLKKIAVPNAVTRLGNYTFAGCTALESVMLPEALEEIGGGLFKECISLKEVNTPACLSKIGYEAFASCSQLAEFTIPLGVTYIASYAFRNCKSLKEIHIPASLSQINLGTFYGCDNLEQVKFDDGVTVIDESAFQKCKNLVFVDMGKNVTQIGKYAFAGCSSLVEVILSEDLTWIRDYAFEDCYKLSNIQFPDGLQWIGYCAFDSCRALESIEIPASVTDIFSAAFWYTGLKEIRFLGDAPSMGETAVFYYVKATAYYPGNNATWTDAVKQNYGGTLTWVCYDCIDGHTEAVDEGYDATCTTPGLTEGRHCSVCGEVLAAQEEIPASHTEVIDEAVAPTCTVPGLTAGSHCAACGEVLTAQTEIPATGHTEVIDEAVDASCTTPGLTEGKHCSVCGEVLAVQEEIPAAHQYEAVYTEPTYDADGFTTYTCVHCGDSYTKTEPGTMKTAVASIGDTKFGTLAEAFAAAKAGDTIQVLKTYTVPSGSSETWDLKNKTLEFASTGIGIVVNGTLKILGGTFQNGFLLGEEKSQVTIEDGIFRMDGGMRTNYGQITINGGTFTFSGDSRLVTQARFSGSNKFSKVVINNGVFYFRDNGAFYDYGLSTINGGTFYLERVREGSIIAGYSDHRDALTITGGTFYVAGLKGIDVDYPAQFYIRGGTFLTTTDYANILTSNGGTIGVYAGTFSQNMTSFLGSDYCCPKNAEGYYVVGRHSCTVKDPADAYLKAVASCLNPAEYYLSCACGKVGAGTFYYGQALEHSFEEYVPNSNATCTINATEIALCELGCGVGHEREIPDSALGHSYSGGICTRCGDINRCGDHLEWTLENGILTITGTGPMYDFTLTDPAPWYELRREITGLDLANGITTIGSYAFYGCTGLTEVTIPESVISIGEYAFGGCSGLKNVTVPDSVTNVSGSAFSGCSGMGTVVIPSGMDKIDDDSLEGCEGLRELWFRGDFPEISANAFKGVVATAWYPADNPTWTADKLLNYGGTITWKPYCLGEHTEVTDEAVAPTCTEPGLTEGRHCSVCGEVFVKQETVPAGHAVVGGVCTMCGLYGTCGDNLTWIFTPESGILSISGRGKMTDYSSPDDVPWALQREYIQKVICIPGITSVGSNAFLYCEALTSVTIPKGVTIIGDCAFYGCSALTEVKLPEGVTDIGNEAFAVCYSLKGIEIPDTVTRIGAHAFKDCGSLLDIQLPDKVSYIGMGAFYYCSSLRSMVIPLGVTSIYNSTFAGCNSLNKIVLPESVKVIGSNVFDGCISLNEITIPKSVTSINTLAFKDCNNLHAIYFLGNAPFFDADVFNGVIATAYYPANNDTWTAEKIENCGGIITWEPYCPNGHTEVNDEAVAPTCTEPGLTEGKHCSACGEVLVAQEEIPATGHSFEENVCTSCGIVGITLKTQPEDAYALEGEDATVTVEAEGEELTYKWFYRNAGASGFVSTSAFTGNTYKVAMNAARSGRQLYCMITDKYGNSVATDIVTIGLKTPLEITGQPVSVTVAEGANAIATVRAEGDDLTYAWYYKNAGDKAFHLTESFKGASYTVKMNEDRNGRQVYCVITDRYGNSLKSDTVTLSMRTTLLITGQPESVTVVKNETAAVTVAAQGDGLTYQWYFKDISHTKFYLTNSFKGTYYQIQMNDARSGRQVYCVVTDQYGNSTVSDTATLSMMTLARITRQPESVKVDEGANAVASIRAEGDDLTYQWYFKDTSHSKFYLTNSFKGSSYTVSMNESRDGRQVYCVITDRYGNSVQSNTVTLSMIHPVTITKQPVSVAVPEGETAKLTLEARGEGLSYAWYYKNAGAGKFTLTTTFTGSTYSVSMNESRSGRQVYCVVTDQYGNTAVSDTVTLSLRTPLRITQQPVSARVAEGTNAVVSLRAQGDGLTYQWYWAAADSDHFQLTNTFRGSSYTVSMNDSRDGRQVYCVITDRYGDSVTSDTVTLAMIRPVKLVKMPELAIANEGEKLSVTLEALGDGLTYAWYFKNAGGTKFYLTTSFTGPTYSVIMNSERDGRQIYCVVTDQYGYSVTSDTLTLQMRK